MVTVHNKHATCSKQSDTISAMIQNRCE